MAKFKSLTFPLFEHFKHWQKWHSLLIMKMTDLKFVFRGRYIKIFYDSVMSKELRYRACRYVATEWSIFLSFLACKTHKLWKFRFTMDPQYTQIFYRFNPLNKCHRKKLIRFLNTLSLTSIAFPYKSRIVFFCCSSILINKRKTHIKTIIFTCFQSFRFVFKKMQKSHET